jgi:hypothetical protein
MKSPYLDVVAGLAFLVDLVVVRCHVVFVNNGLEGLGADSRLHAHTIALLTLYFMSRK